MSESLPRTAASTFTRPAFTRPPFTWPLAARPLGLVALLSAALLSGCGAFTLPPLTSAPAPVTPAPRDYTVISAVQGSGAASPLVGQTVTTQGVVTAVSQDSFGTGGFYLQAALGDSDSNPATSEGLYVACPSSCYSAAVGDLLRVTGTVGEPNTQTVLSAAAVTRQAAAQTLPAPVTVTLPVASLASWEAAEGMRVRVQGVVSNNFTLGRFGDVTVADRRPYAYTQTNAPGKAGYDAYLVQLTLRQIVVDDFSIGQNAPEVFGRGNQPLSAGNTLRAGDAADVTGVLSYAYATGASNTGATTSLNSLGYRLLSTPADATFTGTRPPAPTPTGNLTVASANVLNFFTTIDGGSNTCTADGTAPGTARGANSCTEYTRQLDKVVSNLAGLNADVIGLMEVQNNARIGTAGGTYSLDTLVNALNTRLGSTVYSAVANPNTGTDVITVAMIYKKANVTPLGAALNDTDPINSRYPLAQVFRAAGGTTFAVVVNHLKSKGSGSGVNADQNDGQGASANQRELQVARLLDLIQNRIVNGLGVANVVSVGDYNAYDQEPALANLRKGLDGVAGNTDDLSTVFDQQAYSYQFGGQFGSLDHAYVTQGMKALLTGGEKWHDNSDEPVLLDYNTEFKSTAQVSGLYDNTAYRSSDHDPLKVGFNLPALSALGVTASGASVATPGQPYTLSLSTTGTPDSASIDWGDGTAISSAAISGNAGSATHTYAAAGTPTITVTVTRNADSSTATGTKSVSVVAPALSVKSQSTSLTLNTGTSGSLNAVFTATNAAPVSYSGTVSGGPNGDGSGLSISSVTPSTGSGDGDTSVTANLNAVAAGSYTVKLTASGQSASSAEATFAVTVTAAPTGVGKLVISEFRFRGTAGGNDEFIELFNSGTAPIDISGYTIDANSSSTTAPWGTRATVPANKTLQPNQFYLLTNSASPGFTFPGVTGDQTYSTGFTDNRAIRVRTAAGVVVDLVGFATSAQCETTCLTDGATANPAGQASYKRKLAGGTLQDTDNNAADFEFTATGANPQNSASTFNNAN